MCGAAGGVCVAADSAAAGNHGCVRGAVAHVGLSCASLNLFGPHTQTPFIKTGDRTCSLYSSAAADGFAPAQAARPTGSGSALRAAVAAGESAAVGAAGPATVGLALAAAVGLALAAAGAAAAVDAAVAAAVAAAFGAAAVGAAVAAARAAAADAAAAERASRRPVRRPSVAAAATVGAALAAASTAGAALAAAAVGVAVVAAALVAGTRVCLRPLRVARLPGGPRSHRRLGRLQGGGRRARPAVSRVAHHRQCGVRLLHVGCLEPVSLPEYGLRSGGAVHHGSRRGVLRLAVPVAPPPMAPPPAAGGAAAVAAGTRVLRRRLWVARLPGGPRSHHRLRRLQGGSRLARPPVSRLTHHRQRGLRLLHLGCLEPVPLPEHGLRSGGAVHHGSRRRVLPTGSAAAGAAAARPAAAAASLPTGRLRGARGHAAASARNTMATATTSPRPARRAVTRARDWTCKSTCRATRQSRAPKSASRHPARPRRTWVTCSKTPSGNGWRRRARRWGRSSTARGSRCPRGPTRSKEAAWCTVAP